METLETYNTVLNAIRQICGDSNEWIGGSLNTYVAMLTGLSPVSAGRCITVLQQLGVLSAATPVQMRGRHTQKNKRWSLLIPQATLVWVDGEPQLGSPS